MLLRKGIRGGTENDILRSLGAANGAGEVLLKLKSPRNQPAPAQSLTQTAKRATYTAIGATTGSTFGPWVRMAVRKV